MRFLVIAVLLSSFALGFVPWPQLPTNSAHPIGNAWGNFQKYDPYPHYLHNGQDIMTDSLAPCVVVKAGYVKRVWYGGGPMYNGVTVGDSAGASLCNAFMYYHLDNTTIRVSNGDTVQVGDTLGLISTWSVANFHHNHFSMNYDSGTVWLTYGVFYRNPLLEMRPQGDTNAPYFMDAVTGQRFAICLNNTSTYLSKDSVYGNVDLICRVVDHILHPTWRLVIYKMMYTIEDTLGSTVVPLTRSFEFCDSIQGYASTQADVVFKQDNTCRTQCNYDSLNRRYFYIFTNTDGDSLILPGDAAYAWNTTQVSDGFYWIKVIVSDEYGHTTRDSMRVKVVNNPGQHHDVGVTAITSPPAMMDSGATVVPACSVYNFGNNTESYMVRMRIGTVYDTTVGVLSHGPGTTLYVPFPSWSAHVTPGQYAVSCSTQLAGETYPANDSALSSVTVVRRVHDVGAAAILAPTGSPDSGTAIVPQAVVTNYGAFPEDFVVHFWVDGGYTDAVVETLAVGQTDTVSFRSWVAHPVGTLAVRCSTALPGDVDPSNNLVVDTVRVQPLVGISEQGMPLTLRLASVRPNPTSGPTLVRFGVPERARVRLELFDATGRRTAELVSRLLAAGWHTARIDALKLPAGVYWLRLATQEGIETRKVQVQH
ncbi:MAG: T9SS type A sorting domain-containing protein [candidate division WOR-3 bacterium]|nr:MAG: T9SS type A sorting domain-containing protein [candidate division WOR-3 bacterium]